jgi:argininosuccinate lyase
VPFRTAHAIAGRLSGHCGLGDVKSLAVILGEVCREATGEPLELSAEELTEILSPRHFVDVRCTPGGPSPNETARALEQAVAVLDADRAWLARARAATTAADERLRAKSLSL